MFKTTLFLAVQHLHPTGDAAGGGRHRGRRAHERLVLLGLPGSGRHRRVMEAELPGSDAQA
ncbi:hypothetical protein [Streptomyces chromofuscus]|uniref:Uncharacterized protein n=1 Tax=Streptomyces chromofuscus TaxID=42881 RepID=A0A7M2T554_STRCW|nr:hypothetical protein [Streptomyces chromofuscus]QOV43817.1 hypothetical protein IPT68_29670 [Streptomyces chromofuscus]GGT21647.1 hypothetical protein GCM10010254_47750 [Streptomyces chromofuscus]